MMNETSNSAPRTSRRPVSPRGSRHWLAAAIIGAATLGAVTACKDSVVPYFDAPTSIPTSPTGIQNAVTGIFARSRNDVGQYIDYATSSARDFFWFLTAAPPVLTVPGGLQPVAPGSYTFNDVWDNEYNAIKEANTVIASLANVSAYTPAQVAAVTGVAQTLKAINFMILAETRDTIGIPLYSMDGDPTSPPYCNMDVWKYIVALLDSGNTDLNTAGPIALPVVVAPGFAAVGQVAAPSTTKGSFASLNRALAGKAGLELAYAIARNSPATHPTPTSPGAPDQGALTRADSALTASALYNPAVIVPPVPGNFPADGYSVFHSYSGSSGDVQNTIFASYFLYNSLYDLAFDVDTVNDLRYKNKLAPDPQAVQVAAYAGVSNAKNFVPYAQVSSPIPFVRAEELALVRAQIKLGMGDLAGAVTLINLVHEQAGGFATPLSIALTYTAVRDSLLKEQRISTVMEGSGDRMIALRMYHLEAVADTTWEATSGPDAAVDAAISPKPTDYHTTVTYPPTTEYTARGGSYALSCP